MSGFREYKQGDADSLRAILSRKDIFGVDLYEIHLAEKVVGIFNEMNAGKGSVRQVLHKTVS